MDVLLPANSQVLRVNGIQDEISGDYFNAAAVTARVKTSSGVEVAGQAWPLTLDYVAASNGNYIGSLSKDLALTNGRTYIIEITVDGGGGLGAFWKKKIAAQDRGF